jgi:hypothetical protein
MKSSTDDRVICLAPRAAAWQVQRSCAALRPVLRRGWPIWSTVPTPTVRPRLVTFSHLGSLLCSPPSAVASGCASMRYLDTS